MCFPWLSHTTAAAVAGQAAAMRRQVGSGTRSSSTMKLKTGIVGMPNVGKSTLFNAVTEAQGAMCANYPFATIEPNIGVVEVPDGRLNVLAEINKSVKTVPSTLDFYDIAGLVKVSYISSTCRSARLLSRCPADAFLFCFRSFSPC